MMTLGGWTWDLLILAFWFHLEGKREKGGKGKEEKGRSEMEVMYGMQDRATARNEGRGSNTRSAHRGNIARHGLQHRARWISEKPRIVVNRTHHRLKGKKKTPFMILCI